jgi:hypothetical protein
MAAWEDVAAIALALPEVTEQPLHGWRTWRVRKKLFVWERPLSAKEIEVLGGPEPEGRAPDGESSAPASPTRRRSWRWSRANRGSTSRPPTSTARRRS